MIRGGTHMEYMQYVCIATCLHYTVLVYYTWPCGTGGHLLALRHNPQLQEPQVVILPLSLLGFSTMGIQCWY